MERYGGSRSVIHLEVIGAERLTLPVKYRTAAAYGILAEYAHLVALVERAVMMMCGTGHERIGHRCTEPDPTAGQRGLLFILNPEVIVCTGQERQGTKQIYNVSELHFRSLIFGNGRGAV